MIHTRNDPDRIKQLIQAERAWLEAHLRLDISALDRLMAAEYKQVNSRGELITKQEALASFRAGNRHWEVAESDEYQIEVYEDVAVVFGRWRAKGVNAGQAFDYAARYVSVWVDRDGRWQMVSDQSSAVRGPVKSLWRGRFDPGRDQRLPRPMAIRELRRMTICIGPSPTGDSPFVLDGIMLQKWPPGA